jgi:hypothetical protein
MTSIQRWLGKQEFIEMPEVEESIIKAFSQVFNITHLNTTTLHNNPDGRDMDFDLLLEIEKRLEDKTDLTA